MVSAKANGCIVCTCDHLPLLKTLLKLTSIGISEDSNQLSAALQQTYALNFHTLLYVSNLQFREFGNPFPRVLILHLKRYGYNSQLSKNSKRVDHIRIPRFINVGMLVHWWLQNLLNGAHILTWNDSLHYIGHLCSEDVSPPCEFRGPWPRLDKL